MLVTGLEVAIFSVLVRVHISDCGDTGLLTMLAPLTVVMKVILHSSNAHGFGEYINSMVLGYDSGLSRLQSPVNSYAMYGQVHICYHIEP